MKRLASLLLSGALIAAGIGMAVDTAAVVSAQTQAPCNPGRSPQQTSSDDNFVGWKNNPSGKDVAGVTSSVLTYAPYTDNNYVSAWTMLYSTAGGESDYAQIGYIDDSEGGFTGQDVPIFFIETNGMTSGDLTEQLYMKLDQDDYSDTPTVGDSYTFTTLYDSATNSITFQLDGQDPLYLNTATGDIEPLGSFTPDNWTPNSAQNFGEAEDQSSQMVGDMGDSVSMTNAEFQLAGSSQWLPMNDAPTYPATFVPTATDDSYDLELYGYQQVSDDDLNVWDWACPYNAAALDANTDTMYVWANAVGNDTSQGMYAGTSPAITYISGGYDYAFESNLQELDIYNTPSGTTLDTGDYMEAGSSPAIVGLSATSYEVAFENTQGNLCTYTSSGVTTCTSLGMNSSSSSPSIADVSGTPTVAFRANNNTLYTYTASGGGVNTSQGMQGGTNPSICGLSSGGWVTAFQANVDSLYTYTSGGSSTNRDLGMNSVTSPSAACLTVGGYEIAAQANTDQLWLYSSSSGTGAGTDQGMDSNSSPSIAPTPNGGFVVTFQNNGDSLYTYANGDEVNTLQGMNSVSNPSNAAP